MRSTTNMHGSSIVLPKKLLIDDSPFYSVKRELPEDCFAGRCDRDRCSLKLDGSPSPQLAVDVDALSLSIENKTRCDYLFLGQNDPDFYVVPIELTGRNLSVTDTLYQLQKGADYANQWLPTLDRFRFVPILAHSGGLNKAERDRLLKRTITFRKRKANAVRVKCGSTLVDALSKAN